MNMISPATIIQVKKDYQPYIDEEVRQCLKEVDIQLSTAIDSGVIEEWRLYKSIRNQINKFIDIRKRIYYEKLLERFSNLWKTVKDLSGSNVCTIPRRIISGGKTITSPKKLADACNNFFVNKVGKIRTKFIETDTNPIKILEKLVPRAREKFILPFINQEEAFDIIKNLKCSNSAGYDAITSNFIKKIPDITSIYLTHAINASIRENQFPECLKITRILPISKV